MVFGMNFCCAALAPAVFIADFTHGETRLTAALSRRELARDRLRRCCVSAVEDGDFDRR